VTCSLASSMCSLLTADAMITATRSVPTIRRENAVKGNEHDVVLVGTEGGGALGLQHTDDAAGQIVHTDFATEGIPTLEELDADGVANHAHGRAWRSSRR